MKKPWHENDAFWKEMESVFFDLQCRKKAVPEIENILQLLNLKQHSKILDLGCGVGRHALELSRRGFQVTGVDRTAHYLETAKAEGESEGLKAEWAQADMRSFRRPNSFDLALNLFSTFGYFETPEDDQTVARNVYDQHAKRMVVVAQK